MDLELSWKWPKILEVNHSLNPYHLFSLNTAPDLGDLNAFIVCYKRQKQAVLAAETKQGRGAKVCLKKEGVVCKDYTGWGV